MSWLYLILAGLLEICWAVGLKFSHNFTRPIITLLTIITMALSFFFLSLAMKVLPLGTSYAIWTGVGAVGTALVGIFFFGESTGIGRIAGLLLIFSGIVCLKLSSPE